MARWLNYDMDYDGDNLPFANFSLVVQTIEDRGFVDYGNRKRSVMVPNEELFPNVADIAVRAFYDPMSITSDEMQALAEPPRLSGWQAQLAAALRWS